MKGSECVKKSRKRDPFLAEKTDPNGSYTGKPLNPEEIPVQDADDL